MKLGAKSLDTKGRGVPFKFYTAYYVSTYSRRKAYTLRELLEGVKTADKNTLFHHVFHAVRAKHLLPPRYNNDFARWVGEEVATRSWRRLCRTSPAPSRPRSKT